MTKPWLPALALLASAPALAAPSLANQAAWTEKEKKEFLDFLDSGRGAAPEGQVKEVANSDEEPGALPRGYGRKPFYLALEGISHLTVTSAANGASADQSLGIGPRLILGWHLFSWVRYSIGLEYSSIRETLTNGTSASVGHVHFPLGVELALIPLGAPHTQYFILRAGLGLHVFDSDAAASSFTQPLLGARGSWNLGLGYEWQIAESRFRWHAIAETQIGFKSDETRFYSAGVTAGLVYMF